jgi:hypothetical protein
MKWYQIVEQNTRTSALSNTLFEELESRINGDISLIEGKQEEYRRKAGSDSDESVLVHFSHPHVRVGEYGQKIWQLRSSLAEVTLYVNSVVGCIEGRVDKTSALKSPIKWFALSPDKPHPQKSEITVKNQGCYATPELLGWFELIEHISESIVADLALGSIDCQDVTPSVQQKLEIQDEHSRNC